MRVRGAWLKGIVALLAALPVSAQTATPVLSSIQSPYPPLQSKVAMPPGNASTPYPPGTVSYGPMGTPLVLSGANFGGGGSILFPAYNQSGTVAGIVTSWSGSIVFVTVPTGAGAGGVSVVPAGGNASNSLPFIVTPGLYTSMCPASPPTNQFQITTSSLPNGMAGQSYSVTLSASGGTLPYTWSLTGQQQLPAGLSLNASTGAISGTPTKAGGPLTLNVEARDHSSPALISNVALSLTIAGSAGTPTVSSLNPPSGSAGLAVNISGSAFGAVQGAVTFDGAAATVLSWSDSAITAIVPSNPLTGPVVVTPANGQTSNNNVIFTVSAALCNQL